MPEARQMFSEKLSATKLARKLGVATAAFQAELVRLGYVDVRSGFHHFTDLGLAVGGEWRQSPGGSSSEGHMIWPADLLLAPPIADADPAKMQA